MSDKDHEHSSSSIEANQSNSSCTESMNGNSDDPEEICSDSYESIDEQNSDNPSDIAEDSFSEYESESMDEQISENLSENDGSYYESASDQSDFGWEMDNGDMAIAFTPDYILFRDIYCTDPKVTFSANFIKVNGSTAYKNNQIFSIEVAIDDVVDIKSIWCGEFDMAQVILSIITRDSNEDDSNSSTDIEKLEFIVVDSHWFEKIEAILSLDVRYKAMWDCTHNFESKDDQEGIIGNKTKMLPSHFPTFEENFEEVIYPQGDIDAVSISMRDVDLLKPDTFINDTIIDFYIKYLKKKISPEEKHRYHFFNCFFFRKLADMDKDPSSAIEGRAAFLRVRKWTRKVNLFDKDFIFIPVNYNFHWSLIVICHASEIANFKEEDIKTSSRVPCILHMDSLKGNHINLKDLFQSYLWEEWKERQKSTDEVEDISLKFTKLRFVPLELPQQQNLYDCGLFLLHFVELFLEDAPKNFTPFNITKHSRFLTEKWFPNAEPSLKRRVIHKLIYDLLNKNSKSSPSASNHCGTHNVNEINVLEASPCFMGSQSHVNNNNNDSGLVLNHLFNPISEEYQVFNNVLPSMEVEKEPDTTVTESDLVGPKYDGIEKTLGNSKREFENISKVEIDENTLVEETCLKDKIISYTRRSAKRMKLACPSEVEREFSSTPLSKDLHL